MAGVVGILCCNAANADLGLTFWSHQTSVFQENQQDRHTFTPSILPGLYMQDTLAEIDDTSVAANFTAMIASTRVELTITSSHLVWPPSNPDDGADAIASALFSIQPTMDVVVAASAAGTYELPHDDTSFAFVFEVLNFNFDLIHRAHAGVGVPGSDGIELDDEFTLAAGSTYYVSIETDVTSYDAAPPPADAFAEGVFNLTLNTVPEPAMLMSLLLVFFACIRREPRRPLPPMIRPPDFADAHSDSLGITPAG